MSPKKFMVIQGPRTPHFANLQRDRAIIGVTTTQNPKSRKKIWAPKSRVPPGESRCNSLLQCPTIWGSEKNRSPPLAPNPLPWGLSAKYPPSDFSNFPKIFQKFPSPQFCSDGGPDFLQGGGRPRLGSRRGGAASVQPFALGNFFSENFRGPVSQKRRYRFSPFLARGGIP